MASSYHLSQLIPRSKISLVCSNSSHCSSIFLYESLATTSNSTRTNPNLSLTPKCQLFYPLCAESCPTFHHLTGCSPPGSSVLLTHLQITNHHHSLYRDSPLKTHSSLHSFFLSCPSFSVPLALPPLKSKPSAIHLNYH